MSSSMCNNTDSLKVLLAKTFADTSEVIMTTVEVSYRVPLNYFVLEQLYNAPFREPNKNCFPYVDSLLTKLRGGVILKPATSVLE